MRSSFVAAEVGAGLRRNLGMTIAVVLTVAVSLTLLGTARLAQDQVGLLKGYWYDKVNVTMFLCGRLSTAPTCDNQEISNAARDALNSQLNSDPQVKKVYYESPQEAFTHFKEQFKGQPDLIASISPESLPDSFRVKLKNPKDSDVFVAAYASRQGVEQVQDQRRALEDFFSTLGEFQHVALVFALIQILAALVLIFNIIRVATFSRRREVGIMRLVGATRLYISLPFMLETAIAGLLGAGLAIGLLALGKIFVVDHSLRRHLQLLTTYVGWHEVIVLVPWLLLGGLGLALVGSLVSLQRHLRV